MKQIIKSALFICISIQVSCSDFFEKDLESVKVNLIAPADNLETEKSTITFWWDKVQGATNYQLQVVTPSFDSAVSVILDTLISTNQFIYSLTPGLYSWRVSAQNSAYTSFYSYHSFKIDSTLDLQGQEIKLLLPVNEYYTNNPEVIFNWSPLYNAKDYHIDIKSPDWNTGYRVMNTHITSHDTIKLTLFDGSFGWGVYASNNTSNSNYSYRSIYIDTKAPAEPVLKLPVNGTTFSVWPLDLSWDKITDSGSPISYNVLVSDNDSTFSETVLDTLVTTTKISIDLGSYHTFYWKVISNDKAGNTSDTKKYRRFTIKQN